MMISRCLSVAVLSLLLMGVLGCGSGGEKTYKVSGTVKFSDGTPLTTGTVIFLKERFETRGAIDANGKYFLTTYNPNDGAPLGTYQVSIGGEAETLVAKKFLAGDTSELTCEVKAQSNTFDITVEKPK